MISQAKEHPGGPSEWLMEQLMDLGPEQAKKFDDIACAYTSLAYQYGLWTAASVMERGGCTDDGFIDFRGWLISQGREVYMAALRDPDSLADAADYQDQRFVCLDARAMPAIFLGGGAALLKRHVSATDGLCRPLILDDVCLNAKGYERLVGQLSARAAHGG